MFQARLTVNDEGNEQTVLVHAGKAYRDFAAVHTIVEHACPGRNCDATVFPRKGGTTDGNNHIRVDHFVTNPKKKAHAAHCAYDGSRERGKGTVSLSHALEHGLPVILNINIKALRRELPDVRDKKEYNDHRNRKLDYKDYATYSIKDIRDLFSFLERLGTQHAMTGMKSPAWISYKRTLRPIEDCYLGDSTAAIARYIKGAMKRTEHAKKRKKERGKNYAPSLPMLVALDFEKAADVDGQYYSQPVMLPHLPERPFFR
jgi:ribosomal protein L19E